MYRFLTNHGLNRQLSKTCQPCFNLIYCVTYFENYQFFLKVIRRDFKVVLLNKKCKYKINTNFDFSEPCSELEVL